LPISSESTFAGNGPRIYIGPVRQLQKEKITTVPPSAKPFDITSEQIKVLLPTAIRNVTEMSDKLWLASLPPNSTADSIDFLIDLGPPQKMEVITMRARSSWFMNGWNGSSACAGFGRANWERIFPPHQKYFPARGMSKSIFIFSTPYVWHDTLAAASRSIF
jgi:hypothetical protein